MWLTPYTKNKNCRVAGQSWRRGFQKLRRTIDWPNHAKIARAIGCGVNYSTALSSTMRHSQGFSLPEQLSLWLSDDSREFSPSLPRPGLPKRGIPERSRRVAFANTALPAQEQPSNRPVVSNTAVTDPGYEHRRHISGAFVLAIVARVSFTKFSMLRDRQQSCELVAKLPTSGAATDNASTGATNGRPVHPREAGARAVGRDEPPTAFCHGLAG
mmetsp:Transcript_60688/g.198670  ORF Transcript_60688/g.198670 Transcript_60688/m.198670 type:complete len:214 (-) Transcript_60688:167-808(-)